MYFFDIFMKKSWWMIRNLLKNTFLVYFFKNSKTRDSNQKIDFFWFFFNFQNFWDFFSIFFKMPLNFEKKVKKIQKFLKIEKQSKKSIFWLLSRVFEFLKKLFFLIFSRFFWWFIRIFFKKSINRLINCISKKWRKKNIFSKFSKIEKSSIFISTI